MSSEGLAWLSSHHMSNPSPSPSHDVGVRVVLVGAGEHIRMFLLRFLLWKMDSLLRWVLVIAQLSEPNSRVESTQLSLNLSLILQLYWDDFYSCVAF